MQPVKCCDLTTSRIDGTVVKKEFWWYNTWFFPWAKNAWGSGRAGRGKPTRESGVLNPHEARKIARILTKTLQILSNFSKLWLIFCENFVKIMQIIKNSIVVACSRGGATLTLANFYDFPLNFPHVPAKSFANYWKF